MTRREVVRMVFEGQKPPYVPWNFGFTQEARDKLEQRGTADIQHILDGHIATFGSPSGFFEDIGADCRRDYFGVIWDRSVDKDIGVVKGSVLNEPTLSGYEFPDPTAPMFFGAIQQHIDSGRDGFRMYGIGFSLFERAWTLRGMENLMMDFILHPDFVHELLGAIADYNIAQIKKALEYDIDAVHFGDDWGQQHGLQMGPDIWRRFIKPQLKRMYDVVHAAGKFVSIHSCGDVDELFDDLIEIGLNNFNPFQPEVMNVEQLMKQYRGRLSFYGGLSTQKTLPFGSAADVRNETRRLLELGKDGGYILAPAHAVEGDVPIENLLAFIEEAANQPGYNADQGHDTSCHSSFV